MTIGCKGCLHYPSMAFIIFFNESVVININYYKYQLLSEKYISLVKRSCASCVFIDHILKSFESINIIRENERKEMTKIKFQLVNIREILEDDLSRCINPT